MKTIRYYHKGIYFGFEKFDKSNLLTYLSWIRSGNDLKMKNTLINSIDHITQICKSEKA